MARADEPDLFSDGQLEDLFSAFDEVSASESLKASTLSLIASLPGAAVASEAASVQTAGQPQTAQSTQAARSAQAAQGVAAKAAGGKLLRPRLRAFRAAAVAACLTVAVTGGAAYATPVSVVTLTQGDASVNLGVNLFEMSVSASSDDEAGRAIIDSNNLVHVSYGDALVRVVDALDAMEGEGELEVFVESAVEMQREQLESRNQVLLGERAENAASSDDGANVAERSESTRRSSVRSSAAPAAGGGRANASLQADGSNVVSAVADSQLAAGSGQVSFAKSAGDGATVARVPDLSEPVSPGVRDDAGAPDGSDGPIIVEPDLGLQWVHVPDPEYYEEPGPFNPRLGFDELLLPAEDDGIAVGDVPYEPPITWEWGHIADDSESASWDDSSDFGRLGQVGEGDDE